MGTQTEVLALSLALALALLLAAGVFWVWWRGRAQSQRNEALGATLTDLQARLSLAEAEARRLVEADSELTARRAELAHLASQLAAKEAQLDERAAALAKTADERDGLRRQLEEARHQTASRQEELARLRESHEQTERQAKEKLALLEDARERMTKEFKLLSTEILAKQGQNFAKQNETQIGGLLEPLRKGIGEFQRSLEVVQRESTKERAGLSQQIKGLMESSQQMNLETQNLTRALKGKTQTQGAWGEMLLNSILERSGLREGEEFYTQVSHSDETGARLRPDVIVPLPNGERVIIDAKVSLTAFEAYANAETAEARNAALTSHVRSLREHLRGLGGKGYQAVGGRGPEFVIMFVPIEEALSAAVQDSRELVDEALELNVVLATPTALMVALKTVHNLWRIDKRSKNVEEIAERGGKLYDKFAGFVGDMQELGKRMDQARISYDKAYGKLSQGRDNLVLQANKLRELGAKAKRSLAQELIEKAAQEEETALPAPERSNDSAA